MRFKLWVPAVVVSLLLSLSIFVALGCGDDDDDNDDGEKPSDFDDDTSYPIDDDTGNPAQGGESCGCSGCEGCADGYSALSIVQMAEDFEALHPEYGADELGYFIENEFGRADLSECEMSCFDGMLARTVDCVDAGLNCAFASDDSSGLRSCGGAMKACLDGAQTNFNSCLSPCGGNCGGFVTCASACDTSALTPDAASGCIERCMDRHDSCAPIFLETTRIRCFSSLSADFAEIAAVDDAVALFEDYVSCVK